MSAELIQSINRAIKTLDHQGKITEFSFITQIEHVNLGELISLRLGAVTMFQILGADKIKVTVMKNRG
jgi:hypothetical protein